MNIDVNGQMVLDPQPCSTTSPEPTPCRVDGCDGFVICMGNHLTLPSDAQCKKCGARHVVFIHKSNLLYGAVSQK